MLSVIIYCKDRKRMPIRFGGFPFMQDPQADVPAGWCSECGCEVFETGEDRCPRCRKRKERF